jgi:hypothetical protein
MAKTVVRYPWKVWLRPRRRPRQLVLSKGRDFRCAVHGMAQQIRNRANAKGLLVSLLVGDMSVTINSVKKRLVPIPKARRKA